MDIEFRKSIVPGLSAQGLTLTEIYKDENHSVYTFLKVLGKFQRSQGSRPSEKSGDSNKNICRRWAKNGTCEYADNCLFKDSHVDKGRDKDVKRQKTAEKEE
jgi:hypothetical protein